MLSNTCKYALRAVVYLAARYKKNSYIGIREIAGDLNLPTPFLAKILQQLARHRILNSVKGPNGGFSLLKKPESITMLDIVKIIDGEDLFRKCVIHEDNCAEVRKKKKKCSLHDDYTKIRKELTTLFREKTIAELANNVKGSADIFI
jgi:Rrf2 family protein